MQDLVRRPRPLLAFEIPRDDAAEFAGLPQKARDRVQWLLRACRAVAASDRRTETCRQIADGAEVSFNTVYEPWRRFSRSGDWRDLLDRRADARLWVRKDFAPLALHPEFLVFWRARCDANQRAVRPARKALLARWRRWAAGDPGSAIPGYRECPPADPRTGVPAGWSYRNLLLHAPDDVETAATRRGRSAAKAASGTIRTTREGCWPFREIQFDDMWHDFQVNVPGSSAPCRLLQFHAVDHFTTFLFRPGLKPRVTDAATERQKSLNERDFLLYHVNWLLDWGVHPDGTLFQAEMGTAKFPATYQDKLRLWFGDRVTFGAGGMSGAPAFPGAYRERGHGNPNAKALLEGSGKLIHNLAAEIPGQVGMGRDDCPLALHGRTRENQILLALADAVPALREKLTFGFLDLAEAVAAIHRLFDAINSRDDHEIEGWDACGFVVDQFRISAAGDLWLPADRLADHERQLLALAVANDPSLRRRHRLSPAEALRAAMPNLVKPPREAVPDLLGREYGEIVAPRDGFFHVRRPEFGDRPLRFHSTYQDSGGMRRRVENGHQVLAHLNPWKPDVLWLSDARRGSFLGLAERCHTVSRADRDAVLHAHGRAERDLQDALSELATRTGISRLPALRANAAAIRSAARPNARDRALAAADAAGTAAESMLDDPATIDADAGYSLPDPCAAFDPSDLLTD